MPRLPVRAPPAKGNLVAILLVTVVEKFASSPNAAANSFNVFNAEGELSTNAAISCCTNAVFATVVSLSPVHAFATVIVLLVKSNVACKSLGTIAASAI